MSVLNNSCRSKFSRNWIKSTSRPTTRKTTEAISERERAVSPTHKMKSPRSESCKARLRKYKRKSKLCREPLIKSVTRMMIEGIKS